MHPIPTVERAFALREEGQNLTAISRVLGVSRSQLRRWFDEGRDATIRSRLRSSPCDAAERCQLVQQVPPRPYAYLLGQYLGDGSLTRMPNGVYRFDLATTDAYPDIRAECEVALTAVVPDRSVGLRRGTGCSSVTVYSKHLPCLFPQHGPGPKHRRPIQLQPWQERIALGHHPDRFLRGLIHSDGCRCINRVTRLVDGAPKRYEYVRYFFSNRSADIRALFTEACVLVGVECRANFEWSISVAKRSSIEVLDRIVGPKS